MEPSVNFLKIYDGKSSMINFGKSNIYFSICLAELKDISPNSIDSIITSPPYIDLIDYIQEDLTSINYLFKKKEIELLKAKPIGNKFNNTSLIDKLYWGRINLFLKESVRILKPNSYLILIIFLIVILLGNHF